MVTENAIDKKQTVDFMSPEELRQRIIKDLKYVEDEDLNELAYHVWKLSHGPYNPDGKMTEKQQQRLKESEEAYERGEYLTEEESNRQADEWLKED